MPKKRSYHDDALQKQKSPLLKAKGNPASCLVIYTGGTFGMTPNSEGVLCPQSGFLEQKIKEMDEFQYCKNIKVSVLEWEEPIDSSDMNPDDWAYLAKIIYDNYFDFDGFVVLHGTDTMAYTASALSFMLENLGKPVVLSGAMIPLMFPHSDGRRNLIMSVLCAATLDIPEVCIYSNDQLFRGNRTLKTSNMSVNPFQSPNFPCLAKIGVETVVDHSILLHSPKKRFTIFSDFIKGICVLHLVPGFDDDILLAYINYHRNETPSKPKAFVLSLYGTGNAPLRRKSFITQIQSAIQSGITIVVNTQCIYGRTQLDSYATGISLLEAGAITSYDMTIEACVTKLAYLMGKGYSGKELKREMETNLRGEMSPVITSIDLTSLQSNHSYNPSKMIHNMI